MTDQQGQMLEAAYLLLCEFQDTINNSVEGDHPKADAVDRWLTLYEKGDAMPLKAVN